MTQFIVVLGKNHVLHSLVLSRRCSDGLDLDRCFMYGGMNVAWEFVEFGTEREAQRVVNAMKAGGAPSHVEALDL